MAIHALGMTADETNNEVYVSDTGNGRIQAYSAVNVNAWGEPIDENGDIVDSDNPFASRTIGFSELQKPSGISISPVNGDIYVVDAGTRNVRVYGKDGTSKGVFVSDLPTFIRDIRCSYEFNRFYENAFGYGYGYGSSADDLP